MSFLRLRVRLSTAILLAFTAAPTMANGERIVPSDFDAKSINVTGDQWELTRYLKKDIDSGIDCCFVRFAVRGTTLHDFRCGPIREAINGQMEWTSVYHYKTPSDLPDLLAVQWYEGGAHSANMLRVIKLADDFPIVFDSNEASFNYMEDFDGDGMPEIVTSSFAFDYFHESAIEFSHVDSAYGTLIATYDDASKKFTWANELYPDVLRVQEEERKEAFLKEWPGGEKIPATIAVDQYSKSAYAYRALIRWAISAVYAEGEIKANEIIDEYSDPVLAVFTKHAFQLTLRKDKNYGDMKNNTVGRGK